MRIVNFKHEIRIEIVWYLKNAKIKKRYQSKFDQTSDDMQTSQRALGDSNSESKVFAVRRHYDLFDKSVFAQGLC